MTYKQKFAYALFYLLTWIGQGFGYTVTGLNWLARHLFSVPYAFYDAADWVNDKAALGIGEVEESTEQLPVEEDDIIDDIHLADVKDESELPAHLKRQAD